jgi:protein involved in polysaccharide export with SLBB domain
MKIVKLNVILFVILSFSAILTGCGYHQLSKIPTPSSSDKVQSTAGYVIRPGDELDIKFFYNPELNESVTVRPDGKISLQLVDEVQAGGLKPAELDEMLTRQYSKDLNKPEVTVIVRTFSGQRIYVGGEVNRQREMELRDRMTILQAVFQAGGFNESASPENTILIRQGPNNEPVPIRIDLKNAMYGQGDGADLFLRPNDILYIPKSAIAKANTFVNQYIERLILFRGFSAGVTYQLNKNVND